MIDAQTLERLQREGVKFGKCGSVEDDAELILEMCNQHNHAPWTDQGRAHCRFDDSGMLLWSYEIIEFSFTPIGE
ncbi:hypothetical protein [Pseudomonas soli]|uniref:hypothetical protein n=1 Tax=Pseudomonas soli TaxID=1306993 RepID=UPI00345CC91B